MTTPLIVDYFSDVLCVWAWIAQRRNEELQEQWGEQVELRHHFLNVFGDTAARMEKQWADRGGYGGFGRHVVDSAAPYDDGSAAAALMTDCSAANQQNITGSPSWVMNEGRQTLYGNVGYQVLHANVKGLLSHSGEEASWC